MGAEVIIKALEIRDAATFIPVYAIKMVPQNEEQRYLLWRDGFSTEHPSIMLMRAHACAVQYDPFKWPGGSRTMQAAHRYIEKNFDALADGDVVDVEYILGLRDAPKVSERTGQ